jgi:hypothetical protein
MAERITIAHLRKLAERLNRVTGSPMEAWRRDEHGRNRANIGNYHISCEYGGYGLHRMMNESGGIITPINSGHYPARELYNLIHAYLRGYDDGKAAK